MGYLRTMGAGLAGSTTKIYGNANVNQIQYGDKLQGLPPVTGRRDPYRIYKTKAGGNAPDRFRVFCVNQLGGIGMANKNSQFAPNADGLGWCPNRKNSRQGDIGINKVDRGNDAIRFQSRADEKAEFEIVMKHHEKSIYSKELDQLKGILAQVASIINSSSSDVIKYNRLILLSDELDNMTFRSTGYELIWVTTYWANLKKVIEETLTRLSSASNSNLVLLAGSQTTITEPQLQLDTDFLNTILNKFSNGASIFAQSNNNESLYKQLDTIFNIKVDLHFLGIEPDPPLIVGDLLADMAPGVFTSGENGAYYQLSLGMGGPFPGVPGVGGGGGGFLLVAYKDGTIAFTCGGGFGTGSQEGNVVPTEAELEAKICPSDPPNDNNDSDSFGGGGGMQCCMKGCKTDCTLYCSFGGGAGVLGFGDVGGGGTFYLAHDGSEWTQPSVDSCSSYETDFDARIPNPPVNSFIQGIFDTVNFNKNLHNALIKCRLKNNNQQQQCQNFCTSFGGSESTICNDADNAANLFVKEIGNVLIGYMPECP